MPHLRWHLFIYSRLIFSITIFLHLAGWNQTARSYLAANFDPMCLSDEALSRLFYSDVLLMFSCLSLVFSMLLVVLWKLVKLLESPFLLKLFAIMLYHVVLCRIYLQLHNIGSICQTDARSRQFSLPSNKYKHVQ